MTTNMIANMSKEGKHISIDTLARICETLNCDITDVIELVPDEPTSAGGKEHEQIETKNRGHDRGIEAYLSNGMGAALQ